jgi:exodeoxyribonuclease V alpha subunit
MLQRNLLYTAVTRGKQLVLLVGPEKAIRMALNKQDSHQRMTLLAERLRDLDGA